MFPGHWQFKGQEYKFLFLYVSHSPNFVIFVLSDLPPSLLRLICSSPPHPPFPVSADALQRLRTHPVAFHPTALAIKVLFYLFFQLLLTHQTSVSRTCFYCLKKSINNQGRGWKKLQNLEYNQLAGAQVFSEVLFSGGVPGELGVPGSKSQTEKLNFIRIKHPKEYLLSHPKLCKYLGRSVGFTGPVQ